MIQIQMETKKLRENLVKNMEETMESRLKTERAEKDRYKDLNKQLQHDIKELGREINVLRENLANNEADGKANIAAIMKEYSDKISIHEILIADIRDEKDLELGRVEARLRMSLVTQDRLKEQIELVSSQFEAKESDIRKLMKLITTDLSSGGGELDWSSMIHNLESTFLKLNASQKDARQLINTLEGLISEQHRHLDQIRDHESQANKIREEISKNLNGPSSYAPPPAIIIPSATVQPTRTIIGQMRKHLEDIAENTKNILGSIVSRNQSRSTSCDESRRSSIEIIRKRHQSDSGAPHKKFKN